MCIHIKFFFIRVVSILIIYIYIYILYITKHILSTFFDMEALESAKKQRLDVGLVRNDLNGLGRTQLIPIRLCMTFSRTNKQKVAP